MSERKPSASAGYSPGPPRESGHTSAGSSKVSLTIPGGGTTSAISDPQLKMDLSARKDNVSKIKFRNTKFRPESLARIEQMSSIVDEYAEAGLKLTARQLYYQFVSRGYIENKVQSYKTLTNLLTDARYAGLIDWEAIEDRGRQPDVPSEWDSIQDLVHSAVRSYRLPRWENQPVYAELWVEKQALAGVLEPMAREFHVTLSVNKGYSSASAMFEAAQRFESRGGDRRKYLFYLGDHDPSGEDMVRDIEDRLVEFGVDELTVEKVALNMDQVRKFRPPPNPAKVTDSRFEAYAEKYGHQSWEVDALPPNELQRLIRSAFEDVIDADAMEAIKLREQRGKKALQQAAVKIVDSDS